MRQYNRHTFLSSQLLPRRWNKPESLRFRFSGNLPHYSSHLDPGAHAAGCSRASSRGCEGRWANQHASSDVEGQLRMRQNIGACCLSSTEIRTRMNMLVSENVNSEEFTYSSLINHCNNAMVKQVRGDGVFSRLRSDDEAKLGNNSFKLLQNGLNFVEEWNVVVDVCKHHPLTLNSTKNNVNNITVAEI